QIKQESEKRVVAARDDAKKQAEAALAEKLTTAQKEKEVVEAQLLTVKAEEQRLAEERLHISLNEQRVAIEKAQAEIIQKEQSKAFEERQKLQRNLEDLQRQLSKDRADELGESAELDLRETLRDAFPNDRF